MAFSLRHPWARMERLAANWPYLLSAIPMLGDWISHGPLSPFALATDLISGLMIFSLVAVLQKKNRLLTEHAVTDKLTGLYNSRHLRTQLERQVRLARRTGSPLSMIFMDLDNLKRVNDRRGHAAGSELLRQFAESVASAVRRDMDLSFRYGGDEFVVLCPQTPLLTAREVALRLCRIPESLDACRADKVTLSLGVIELKETEYPAEFIARADRVMYEVKRRGKNEVGMER